MARRHRRTVRSADRRSSTAPPSSPTPSWSRRPAASAPPWSTSGIEPGDRVAIWAFNSAQWVVAALGLFEAGAVLVPDQHPVQGSRGRRHPAPQPGPGPGDRHRLPRDRLRDHARRRRRRAARPDHDVVAEGPARPGRPRSGTTFMAGRHGSRPTTRSASGRTAVGADDPSDILFTSGTTGVAQGRGPDPRPHPAGGHRLGGHDRTDGRRPLSDGQPVLPHVRAEGRHPRRRRRRGHHAARSRCSTSTTCWPWWPSTASPCCPVPPPSTRASSTIPSARPYDLSTLRVAVTGAADIPVELIRRVDDELPFSLIITGYGLTEAGTAAATSPDDDVETIATTVGRPRPGFELRVVDDRRSRSPPGRPARSCSAGGASCPTTSTIPRPPPRPSPPTAGCAPATSACVDAVRLPADRRPIQGHVHRRAASTPIRPRSRTPCCAIPDIRQVAVIGIPDERLGEVGMAFVVLAPGAPVTGRGHHRVEPRPDGQLQGAPGGASSSTSSRSTPPARW